MSDYYRRRFEVLIDDKILIAQTDGRQFRFTFQILIDFGGFNSYCDAALSNLAATTVGVIKKGSKLSVRAGYADTIDTAFIGTVNNVFRERNGTETITRMICRGNVAKPSINQTLGAGVAALDVIKASASGMGYPVVIDDDSFADVPAYPRGYQLSGDPKVYLDVLADAHAFSYVVENGRLVIVKNGISRDTVPHVVSQFTGMEGIPRITEVGADVTIRLNPKIRIGGEIDIQSELKTFGFNNLYFQDVPETAGVGNYKVQKIAHSGDSYGDDWSTALTCIRPTVIG